MPMRSKISANSFINAMLRSRWVFSMTLAASATLMLLALCTPAVITEAYMSWTNFAVFSSSPETTLTIFVMVRSLSPGLTRSGE